MIGTTIVCPFCPLHCDDVLPGSPPECSILQKELSRAITRQHRPRVKQTQTTIDQAASAAILKVATAGDVTVIVRQATLSQATAIADSGFAIRIEATATQLAFQQAVATCGAVTATLGDIKQYADALVIIGDIETSYPRLLEKIAGSDRTIKRLKSPDADVIADLALAIRTRSDLADSKYVAVVIAPDAIDANQAAPAIELLVETVTWMNDANRIKPQRAVLLSMDPLASIRSVHSWKTNQRLQLATLSDFNRSTTIRIDTPTPHQHRADIQIGGRDLGVDLAEIYLPTSQAGIHHSDAVIRGDGTVTMPLTKTIDSKHPTAVDWLQRLNATPR